jgi:hypothetical protein
VWRKPKSGNQNPPLFIVGVTRIMRQHERRQTSIMRPHERNQKPSCGSMSVNQRFGPFVISANPAWQTSSFAEDLPKDEYDERD